MKSRIQKGRETLYMYFLTEDGMVACNPRDREAAHRAEMEGIATEDADAVTCRKCWDAIVRTGVLKPEKNNSVTRKKVGVKGQPKG